MRKDRTNQRLVLLALLATPLLAAYAHATAGAELSGQWVGNSQVDGDKIVARTSLSLGAADADNTTLRIEGRSTCTLRDGHYAAGADGAWTLSFKEATGNDACARLARGTFTLRAGTAPRQLDFEVTYPAADGGQNLRRGALSRYP
jgi:hypothetical protein